MVLPVSALAQSLLHAPIVHRSPDAASGAFQASVEHNAMLSVKDRAGAPVLTPNGQALWAPAGKDVQNYLEPTITVQIVPGGADITFDFENTSQESKWLGVLYIGGIRFGPEVHHRLFQADGKEVVTSHDERPYFGGGGQYPGALYSPVATLREGDTTIGVSLLYPVLDYKHSVFIRVESPGGKYTESGRNWQVMVHLSPLRPAGSKRDIEPGEKRTYTLALRIAMGDPKHDWMRTLLPYQNYFHAHYGDVQYKRDGRPVRAIEIAGSTPPTHDNTRAFTYEKRRIDVHGWRPWINVMRAMMNDGYRRFMLIAPTGMYNTNRHNNYPFQFTSGWKYLPAARAELPLLADFGQQLGIGGLGLWWGRSAQVMTTWDASGFEVLTPDNPAHRARAHREMDLAVLLNATVVGLDAFSYMDAWDGYLWVTSLRRQYPGVKFIVEPLAADFLHTIAGSYVYGLRSQRERDREPSGPLLLADFLSPGHETWARIDVNAVKAKAGLEVTDAILANLVRMHASQLASWGFIPIIHAPGQVHNIFAAPSWETSIPPDLVLPEEP